MMIKLRDDFPEFISENFSIVDDGLIMIPHSSVKKIRDLIPDTRLVKLGQQGHLQALAMDCQKPRPIIRIQIGEQAPITLTFPDYSLTPTSTNTLCLIGLVTSSSDTDYVDDIKYDKAISHILLKGLPIDYLV